MPKTLRFQGVPFSVLDTNVYIYGTTTQIGTYDVPSSNFQLNDGWEASPLITASLAEYRKKLHDDTTSALAKAAELQK